MFIKNPETSWYVKEEKPRILVDISTFTREALLIILKYLEFSQLDLSNVQFFYRKAVVSDDLSGQVLQIRSVLGYMGNLKLSAPLHLIVMSGFEYSRAKEIIDTLEPDQISIGFGSRTSSVTDELFERNTDFTNKLMAYYSNENIHVFEHSLLDPLDTRIDLQNVVNKFSDYNTVIAPLNNKVSTLGAGLLAISNPDIQICYSQMGNYNESSYSSPIDDFIVFNFSLS